jgi:hypothetical protein
MLDRHMDISGDTTVGLIGIIALIAVFFSAIGSEFPSGPDSTGML